MTSKVQYPEHEKLHAIKDKSQKIGEFLDWCQEEKGWCLCENTKPEGQWVERVPIQRTTQQILAEFFEIDLNVLEAEKQAMLDVQRKLNAGTHKICHVCGECKPVEDIHYVPAAAFYPGDLQAAIELDDAPDKPCCTACVPHNEETP